MITSDTNFRGNFDSIEAVWEAIPYGGVEGDYLNIQGVKYRWNKYLAMWENAEVVTETPARDTVTFDEDVNMQNNLTVAGVLRAKKFVVDDLPTGIEEVEITESAVSGGNNVITFTYTNGETQTFIVKNGEAGKTMGAFGYASSTASQSTWNTAKNYLVPTATEGEFDVYTYEGDAWYQVDTFQVDIAGSADAVEYDNSQSGLAAENVQGALDEIENSVVEIEGHLYKVVNTVIVDLQTTQNQKAAFSNDSIGFEVGKKYRIRSFNGSIQNVEIVFYLREQEATSPLWKNAGVNIPAGDLMSSPTIYKCVNDSAQYLSVYRSSKGDGTKYYRVRIEELGIVYAAPEDEVEENDYNEVPVALQAGAWQDTCVINPSANRISTPLIKTNGNFYFTLDSGYDHNVLYFDNEFTLVKKTNSFYYLDGKFKDSWNGYIGVMFRKKDNENILPSDIEAADFHLYNTKSEIWETFGLELGSINGGIDVDSDKGCRSVGKIQITKGETIYCTFSLAQTGGVYSSFYKYLNGNCVGDSGTITVNHGSHFIITSDGTFNEIRFRILGTSTWTDELAEGSFIYVERDVNAKTIANTNSIIALQNDFVANDNVLNAIIAQTYKYHAVSGSYNPLQTQGVLTLMQFSDIHSDVFAVKKALELKEKYADYIHDVIHTGDAVATYNTDLNPFTIPENGGSIINLIGNHDAWEEGTYDYEMTEQEVYDSLLADDIASWGVTYESGKTYYYKDYATQKIRVIFVDSIHWHGYVAVGNIHDSIRLANAANEDASAQKTWFEATLAGAKAAGYAVVCITHYSPEKGINFLKNTGFNFYTPDTSGVVTDGWFARDEIFGCVDTFISSGGKFLCWLMGHCHRDMAGTLVDHPNQFMIGIDRGGSSSFSIYDRHVAGTPSAYVFNVTTFDSTNNLVKITRLGNSYDVYMQSKKTLCYDLTNKRIIYNT